MWGGELPDAALQTNRAGREVTAHRSISPIGTRRFCPAVPHLLDYELDLRVFDEHFRNDQTGAPAYGPSVMLKVIMYAFLRRINPDEVMLLITLPARAGSTTLPYPPGQGHT
jgi:hypothetical protein